MLIMKLNSEVDVIIKCSIGSKSRSFNNTLEIDKNAQDFLLFVDFM